MKRSHYISYQNGLKQTAEQMAAVILLLLLWPLLLLVALAIRLDSKGNVLFCQQRLGKGKKEFTIYKFRTMKINHSGDKLRSEQDIRITRIGTILRKTSLDELPQLINILIGDMGIIGPRPVLQDEFKPFKGHPVYEKRFNTLPGLFCTVDMSYRATATREQQFQMDAEYVENITFLSDMKIFGKVFINVLKRKNIYPVSQKQQAEEIHRDTSVK
ncbi:UDP-phosphate galactose phosphotransferase [Anaerocolumna cellulosilytica]|uniref:UDP-phosphate galactose phosphotransferase n=1 Tax=Anaerocolumna cellulosilytica TaxID=433286 RepID=A0A6S6QY65_9FIRM|nr:sugar transferase [Anaerocolumna cellulosilytica]MBB5194108.1 lipopolysaccharide/colanic/teichoic acid biosynthesis glycosyltransferase [Anaerocolumna cellulosilytica]BCJ94676.1 UDP-phosphate galactose phosphotransferase [Anaerocolumna cellulosilytica]